MYFVQNHVQLNLAISSINTVLKKLRAELSDSHTFRYRFTPLKIFH